MNDSNRDNFERIAQLAEFGAKRHDERRQVEFRVFIAYNTLLVLAFYYLEKIERLNAPWWANIVGNLYVPKPLLTSLNALWWVTIGLVVIHFVYLLWQVRLSVALVNDANRRDFYLKRAECILHHLSEKPYTRFRPRKCRYVTIRLRTKVGKISEKDKATEYDLFKKNEPDIVLISPMYKIWKHWSQLLTDWSQGYLVFGISCNIFHIC